MPENSLDGLVIRMNSVEKRVDRNDQRIDKMESDNMRTDVAILKVELAGEKKKNEIQDAKIDLLESRASMSRGVTKTWQWVIGVGFVVAIGAISLILQIVQARGGR